MLAIGGMTVAELDERMSHAEQRAWMQYVKQYGPLNQSIRFEAAIGRAVLPFLKKGTRLQDLMPWPREEVTPETIGKVLMAAFKAGGGGKKVKYKVRKHGQ